MQATASRGVNDNVASVLMRAEVIQHMDPRSLARCLTTCTALRAPHECDAWKVLADELASSPLPDAASRHAFLRSYCQPRLLAEGLSNLAVSSPLVIDQLDDYVIHLRINMGAVALWEGSVPLEGGGPPFFSPLIVLIWNYASFHCSAQHPWSNSSRGMHHAIMKKKILKLSS